MRTNREQNKHPSLTAEDCPVHQTAHNDNTIPDDHAVKHAHLDALRKQIQKLEYSVDTELKETPPGAAVSDYFQAGHSHEVWAASPSDLGAAMGFSIRTAALHNKPVLWITTHMMAHEHGLPYGPGLIAQGLDPAKLILVRCKHESEALWAMEEGLKNTALSAVVGELTDIDLNSSRRLSLTCRAHGSRTILLLRRAQAASSACYSRWQVQPTESQTDPFAIRAPGATRLAANLIKHRAGLRPAETIMEWEDAPDRLLVAPPVANQPLDARRKHKQATG